ncbi:MAG: hypothetical protein ACRYE8_02590 [Janthinobacterium lividum]
MVFLAEHFRAKEENNKPKNCREELIKDIDESSRDYYFPKRMIRIEV